jgi:predicted DsbA family dithiol-disulfide isomerase
MSNIVKISKEDIIYHLKISCQIPSLLEAIATRTIITQTAKKENITIEIAELQQEVDDKNAQLIMMNAKLENEEAKNRKLSNIIKLLYGQGNNINYPN